MNWRGEWRSVSIRLLGQCVMMALTILMPLSSVDSLDSAQEVSLSSGELCVYCFSDSGLLLQMLIPEQVHGRGGLGVELIPSTLTMLCVLGQSPT